MKKLLSLLLLLCLCTGLSAQDDKEKQTVDRFWSLLTKNPRRGTSLDRVYGYYVDTGQLDTLIDRCKTLTEKTSDDAKSWLLLGLVLSRRNDDAGTVAAYEKAETLDPKDPIAPYYLGEAFIAQGRLKEAAAALERSVERKPTKNDALPILQTLGRVYERFGDRKQSDSVWAKMEELFPNDPDIVVRIAETLEEEGKYAEALSRYQTLAELAKNDNYSRVRFTLSAADIKIRLGNKQEAIADFEKLLDELSSDNWLAGSIRDRVERVFVRQADYAGLAGYYQKRLAQHPNDQETTRRLAVALVRLSRTEEAKNLLAGMLEKAPSNTTLRLALIDLLVNEKDFEAVDSQYEKLNEIDPDNPDHITQWGLAALENRKENEQTRRANAAKIWKRLVDAKPKDVGITILVADLMAGAKILPEAEALYQKAVELAPNDPTYREYLGYFYNRTEQKDKAIAALKQIAEGSRRTAGNLAQLGGIFRALNYDEEAVAAMKDAAELAPKDFELQLRYAEILTEQEKYDAAKAQLEVVQALVESDDELLSYVNQETKLLAASNELKPTADALDQKPDKTAKEFWRLAVYRQAEGNLEAATAEIEKAMKAETKPSLLILERAADIYARGYNQVRAAEIYEQLASIDAAHRIEHLKKLAVLQRDLGQTDKAIETARNVMALGSGNAANSRFYADMLLSIGRRADGIEALRRAVRVDPTDQTSLGALADQLNEAGQSDEAIEIVWRIFDRTEELQGKMSVIAKLSNYYQMSRSFDKLVERLRQNMSNPSQRREAAYCLAQAHASVGDYYSARNALEMLLTGVDEEKTSDTFLLNQLSLVAEMQGDFASAVRYQEMLCDLSSQPQDMNRLLELYFAGGEKDKGNALYLQTILGKGDFVEQIDALDKMLGREDYPFAKALVERLESKYPDNWELMYRKLELSYWLKEGDPQAIAASLRKMSIPEEELSAAKQKELTALKKVEKPNPNAARYGMGSNYSPWGFGQHQGYFGSYYSPLDGGETIGRWRNQNQTLIQTTYRELLQLEQYYYNRGMGTSRTPEKPLFKPDNFGDAKFAALVWELKFAHDVDKPPVVETPKPVEETPQPSDPDPFAGTPEGEDAPAPEEAPPGPKYENFLKLIADSLDALPEKSDDKDVLLARMRLETFLQQFLQQTQGLDPSELPPQAEKDELLRELTSSSQQSMTKLGLLGENEWKQAAFRSVLQSLVRPKLLAQLESVNIDDRIAKARANFPPNVNVGEDWEQNLRKSLEDQIAQLKKEEAEKDKELLSESQKIDWLLDAVKHSTREKPEQFAMLLHQTAPLFDLLKEKNREADITILNDLIEEAGKDNASVYFGMGTLTFMKRSVVAEFGMMEPIDETSESANAPDPFEEMKSWVLKGKDSLIRNLGKKNAGLPYGMPVDIMATSTLSQYLGTRIYPTLNAIYGNERIQEAQLEVGVPSGGGYGMGIGGRVMLSRSMIPQIGIPMGGGSTVQGEEDKEKEEGEEEKDKRKILTQADVDKLAALQKRIFETLDFYFTMQTEINHATAATEKKTMFAPNRQLQSLSQYRYYFDGQNRLDSYQINQLLNPNQPGFSYNEFLTTLSQTLPILDKLVKDSGYADGVNKDALTADCVKRFDDLIAAKENDPDTAVTKIVKDYRFSQSQVRLNRGEESPDEILKTLAKLEEERKEATEKQETYPATKMFLLAMIYAQNNRFEDAIQALDEIPFTSAADVKLRETIVLQLYPRSEQNESMRKRAQAAIDKLLGYQLSSEELMTLRSSLRMFDRLEEADAIRDRLMLIANDMNTMGNLLEELRGDSANQEQAVQFALKVFRSPALSGPQAMRNDSYARYLKTRALDILKSAGKLEEIIEQIEAQWKSSPGSFDLMASLADIYQRADRTEDAKRMVEEMAKQVPDDAQKMLSYSTVLRGLNMNDQAVQWTIKALEKDPKLFFNNYWEYQRTFNEAGQTDKLLDFLKKMKPADMMQNMHAVTSVITDMMRNDAAKEKARALFEHFWNLKDGSQNEKDNMRRALIDQMIFNTNDEFYPYFNEVILKAIAKKDKKQTASNQPQVYYGDSNPNATRGWSSDRSYSLSESLLTMAEGKNKLDDLRKEVDEVLAAYGDDDLKDQENAQRRNYARIFSALLDLKLKQVDQGIEALEELRNDKNAQTQSTLNESATAITQQLEAVDNQKATDLAVSFCETAIKSQGSRGGYVDSFLERKLVLLYLKSGNPDKGKERALTAIKRDLRLVKQMGTNHNIQIGNQYYSIYELSESIKQFGNALKNGGGALDLLLVYRQQCDGQPWYRNLMDNQNFRHYADQIKEPFTSLAERITAEDYAANIGMFLPISADEISETENGDDVKETAAVKPPLELGISLFPGGDEPRVESKLYAGLKILAQNDPEKFAKVRTAIDSLRNEFPDDPTVLLANVYFDCVEGNVETVVRDVKACAAWTTGDAAKNDTSDQVYLGMWMIADELYQKPDSELTKRLESDCEALTQFAVRFVGRKIENRNAGMKSEGEALHKRILQVVPPSVADKITITISESALETSLFLGGRFIDDLNSRYIAIREQYVDAIKAKNAKAVLNVFENVFKNGWPTLENTGYLHVDYAQAKISLWLLYRSLDAMEESKTDPFFPSEALMNIVLPQQKHKTIFLGFHDDLGGFNGEFHSLGGLLIDWAIKANRLDDVKARLDAMATIHDGENPFGTGSVLKRDDMIGMRDCMLFTITAKTNAMDEFKGWAGEYMKNLTNASHAPAQRARNAIYVLFAIDDLGVTPETLELFDAALPLYEHGSRFPRYAYYLIRKHWPALIDSGLDHSKESAVDWARMYRKITKDSDSQQYPDPFRRTIDHRLLLEATKAVEANELALAVAIVKYFAEEPVGSPRYLDMTSQIDALEKRLGSMSEEERKTLLGDFDLSQVAKKGTMQKDEQAGKPKTADNAGLPELPSGKLVYETDFESGVDPNWSTDRRETTPKGLRTYLGDFSNEPVEFRWNDLPEHKYLRIKFDLFILGGADGLMGYSSHFGVDTWELTLDAKSKLIGTSFSNFRKDDYDQKQSYPDDYPPLFGIEPEWYGRVKSDSMWGDNLELGFYLGREGAVENNTLDNLKGAVYAVDLVVPHDQPELLLKFTTQFQDGPYVVVLYNDSFGESWGIDNFRVETLDAPWNATDDELKQCFDAMFGTNGVKSNAARWRLVAAGDKTVDFLTQWIADPNNAGKLKEIRTPGNFHGFRILRLLQLLDSPAAEKMKATIFESENPK